MNDLIEGIDIIEGIDSYKDAVLQLNAPLISIFWFNLINFLVPLSDHWGEEVYVCG